MPRGKSSSKPDRQTGQFEESMNKMTSKRGRAGSMSARGGRKTATARRGRPAGRSRSRSSSR